MNQRHTKIYSLKETREQLKIITDADKIQACGNATRLMVMYV